MCHKMRIFIGIDLDPEVRSRIERFLEGVQGFASDARWVRPESLHITLKFVGEQSQERVAAITEGLGQIKSDQIEIHFAGYGFFPSAKAPRVFWIGVEAGGQLAALAESIDAATAKLGVPREDRPYSPHLTLARRTLAGRTLAGGTSSRRGGGSGSPKRSRGDGPNTIFATLEERLAAIGQIDFGTMMAREFILFRSELSPGGSKYTKLQSFPLQ
jgi:RNA 2',3'-cyclic 3'-phosphodiesterase